MIDFGDQGKLWALALVPLVLVLWRLGERRRRRRMASALGVTDLKQAVGLGSPWRSWLRALLVAFAAACLAIAWAKPRIGYEWVALKRAGTDVVVAVDVSRSMLANDVHPSRLERARREVQDLLEMTRGDRVGLVAFAGKAFIQCPLTEDTSALRLFMTYLDAELIPVQGTNLGAAVQEALAALDAGGQGGGDVERSILLVTDGENLTDKGQAQAAVDLAKSRGVKIHTLAVGTPGGAPVPEDGGGLKKDKSGNVVLTRPDEAALKAMAAATGGVFQRSVAGDGDMRRIFDDGIRANAAVRDQVGEAKERRWHDRYRWFVGLALLALLIEALATLVERTSLVAATRTVAAAVAILIVSSVTPESLLAPVPTATAASGEEPKAATVEELDAAEKQYMEQEIENPDEPRHAFNRGVMAYKRRKFTEAAEAFARAAKSPDPKLAGRSLFNLGNAQAENGAFDEAIAAYSEALKVAPDDKEATENLAYVQKLKEQQDQQQQQDQQKQDQQKQDQQKQDQQKQDQQDEQQKQDEQKKDQQSQDQQQDQQQQDQKGQDQQQDQQQPQDSQSEASQGSGTSQDESSQQGTDQQQSAETQPQGSGTETGTAAETKSGEEAPEAQQAETSPDSGTETGTGVADADKDQNDPSKADAFKRANRGKTGAPTDADKTLEAVQDQISKYIFGNARRAPDDADGRDW